MIANQKLTSNLHLFTNNIISIIFGLGSWTTSWAMGWANGSWLQVGFGL